MKQNKPIELGNRIHLIDGYDLGIPGRTGTYVIREEKLTIVETSASPSVPYILQGLQDLHLDPKDIQYIIVTHIHLDHSGGAGLLLKSCPNAMVVVHPKGARHLAHPERLIEGARAVYGDRFDALFDPILPIPEERLLIIDDGETLSIGPECNLQFLDTPGHANHHFSIFDPVSNGIFTGDTIGVYYQELSKDGVELYLPSTSPNQFNPQAMMESLHRIQRLNVDRIFFGHFGMSEDPAETYRQIEYWLPIFVRAAEETVASRGGEQEITARLYQEIKQWLTLQKIPLDHPVFAIMEMDLQVCAMGLVDYINKKNKVKG